MVAGLTLIAAGIPAVLQPSRLQAQPRSLLAWSPDGRRILSGSYDATIRSWDAAPGKVSGPILRGHSGGVLSLALSPDGQRLVSGSEDKTLRFWDTSSGKALGEPLKGHDFNVNTVSFSPDGRHIASGSEDTKLCIWDGATGQPLFPCR